MVEVNSRVNEALSYQSKYCYPESSVLINKYDIQDQRTLDKIERNVTALMLVKLQTKPLPSPKELFSVNYFIDLHRQVFEHLYPFAGKIRSENITKGNTPFCRPEFIYKYLNMIFDKIFDDIKKIKSKEDIIVFLSYYYSELNVVHPFREGNGRIMREYLRQVVLFISKNLGFDYELDFSNVTLEDKNNLMNGSIISAMNGNLELLNKFFNSMLKEKEVIKGHQK